MNPATFELLQNLFLLAAGIALACVALVHGGRTRILAAVAAAALVGAIFFEYQLASAETCDFAGQWSRFYGDSQMCESIKEQLSPKKEVPPDRLSNTRDDNSDGDRDDGTGQVYNTGADLS